MFNDIKITLYYSVYMRTSGEKVRISDETERVQSISYSHIRSLSGLYTVVSKQLPRAPLIMAPSRYFACKYSSFLVKNLLFAHTIFSEPHHNSVLYPQRGRQQQL